MLAHHTPNDLEWVLIVTKLYYYTVLGLYASDSSIPSMQLHMRY